MNDGGLESSGHYTLYATRLVKVSLTYCPISFTVAVQTTVQCVLVFLAHSPLYRGRAHTFVHVHVRILLQEGVDESEDRQQNPDRAVGLGVSVREQGCCVDVDQQGGCRGSGHGWGVIGGVACGDETRPQ